MLFAPVKGSSRFGKVRRLQFLAALSLLVVTVLLIFHQRPHPEIGAADELVRAAAKRDRDRSYLPLQVGNQWRYVATVHNETTGEKQVQHIQETVVRRERGGFRIIQEVDGSQADSRLAFIADDGIRVLEYTSSRQPVLFLPEGELVSGRSWEVAEGRRATVTETAPIDVGRQELEAVEVRLERYYGEELTETPGWFLDGTFWVARGVGVVRRDSAGSERPRGRDDRPRGEGHDLDIRTLLELEGYELAGESDEPDGKAR